MRLKAYRIVCTYEDANRLNRERPDLGVRGEVTNNYVLDPNPWVPKETFYVFDSNGEFIATLT